MVVQEQVRVALGLIGGRGQVQGNVMMIRKGGPHQGRLARLPRTGHHHRRKVRREPEKPISEYPGVLHPDIMTSQVKFVHTANFSVVGKADGVRASPVLQISRTIGEPLRVFHDQELSHHPGIFMFHDVAVVHVWDLGIGISIEAHDDADGITGRHQDRVFPAELGASGWLAVTIENLELDQVDVERVSLTAGIAHFPDLGVPQSHDLVHSLHIHDLAVDRRPHTRPGRPSSL